MQRTVSRAMSSSSLVGIAQTATRLASVEMRPSTPSSRKLLHRKTGR
jgi:hypothetical protein